MTTKHESLQDQPVRWIVNHWPIVATIGLLLIVNLSSLITTALYGWMIIAFNVVLLLLIARLGNLSMGSLGLDTKSVKSGFIWGGLAVLVVFAVLATAFLIDQSLFLDSRYNASLAHALYTAFIFIPFHTVFVEELAFRGVLWAALCRYRGARFATIVSSLLFGLWHIVPSLGLAAANSSITSTVGTYANIVAIIGAVIVTTAAGIVLSLLREKSNSLVAPIMAHWAVNGIAVLFAALAWMH